MTVRQRAALAVTADPKLINELRGCEPGIEITGSIPRARKIAHDRPMIIVGADLATRLRKPIAGAGLVVLAAIDLGDGRALGAAPRIAATYVIILPTARQWLIDQLRQQGAAG